MWRLVPMATINVRLTGIVPSWTKQQSAPLSRNGVRGEENPIDHRRDLASHIGPGISSGLAVIQVAQFGFGFPSSVSSVKFCWRSSNRVTTIDTNRGTRHKIRGS